MGVESKSWVGSKVVGVTMAACKLESRGGVTGYGWKVTLINEIPRFGNTY